MNDTTNNENAKMILQSYSLTTIRNDFGLYAQRLLVRIAEAMQYRLEDADFTKGVVKFFDKRLEYEFSVRDIMNEKDENYTYVRNELHKIPQSVVRYNVGETEITSALFTDLHYKNGSFKVYLNPNIWDLFIEFSKGYKRYQLKTALKLKTSYSLRLYQLLSENNQPVTYTIDWLKKLFGIENKYARTKDFIKNVIQSAQQELSEKAEFTFDYYPITEIQGKGRPAITGLTFVLRKTPKTPDFELQRKEEDRKYGLGTLPSHIALKLRENYRFTEKGLKANARTFYEAYITMRNPTLSDFLEQKCDKALKAKNPQGWIVNAIRSELETL